MATILNDAAGDAVTVQEGESCNVVVLFKFAGTAIVKASLATITVTLYDKTAGTIINGRNAQNVLDANNGVVATDGTLTLRLGPLDNVIVGTPAVGATQLHHARFAWTWTDGVATRTGIEEVAITVENLVTPA